MGDKSNSSPFPFVISTNPQEYEGEKEQTSPSQVFEKWVALVRKRSHNFKPSGFPYRLVKTESMPQVFLMVQENRSTKLISREPCAIADNSFSLEQTSEMSLWERLGNAAPVNIDSRDIKWSCLSSLHHTEHTSNDEHSEDDSIKVFELTINSGGVVFFALFNNPEDSALSSKEFSAVIKIASSRLTTLSERLGYEFARCLGVKTPQARVIHNFSAEWQYIKDAAKNACNYATSASDEGGEMTCSELLEALDMSRCILLMNYAHGSPLLKNSQPFDSLEAAGNTAVALGRILLLDLVIRNEDRLSCHRLGWRGNFGNLLFVNKKISAKYAEFCVVAIDTVVPRRPPTGKRAKDQEEYPKLVELLLNSLDYSANLLNEISGGNLGFSASDEDEIVLPSICTSSSLSYADMRNVVHKFRNGFRDALINLQRFHLFLITLNQKLDGLFHIFLSIASRNSEESGKQEYQYLMSPRSSNFDISASLCKKQFVNEIHTDSSDYQTHRNTPKPSLRGESESFESPYSSFGSLGKINGKYFKGSGEQSRRSCLTMKLRNFQKLMKADTELNKDIERWIELLRTEVVEFCLENNFDTGFFDGTDATIAIDAYELKVRLEHILDRIALISNAMNTERPSQITDNLFIGGALAAQSIHTLQYLGVTHILCLCFNEIGQSDSQHPELFKYRNFAIRDDEEEDIGSLFIEARDFIAAAVHSCGKVLVHCFEGKSRSVTVVLAYLMMGNGLTLSESWNMLKKVHRRAQPNDGFAKALLELELKLYGKVSMDWRKQKKPVMKMCPICSVNTGLSSGSLKIHLQKSHMLISSGSLDSGSSLDMETFNKKAFDELKISPALSDSSLKFLAHSNN